MGKYQIFPEKKYLNCLAKSQIPIFLIPKEVLRWFVQLVRHR